LLLFVLFVRGGDCAAGYGRPAVAHYAVDLHSRVLRYGITVVFVD
jgi:hypothetical protein